MPRIFISYRREDSQADTGRIYDHLVQALPKTNVFRDVDSIQSGEDFRAVLEKGLASCDVVLVVIGKSWLSVKDSEGRRRLDDEADFVRLEVEGALRRKIRTIPVTVANAALPTAADLPPSLRDLVFRNGLQVRPDPDFKSDINRLLHAIGGEETASRPRQLAWIGGVVLLLATCAALFKLKAPITSDPRPSAPGTAASTVAPIVSPAEGVTLRKSVEAAPPVAAESRPEDSPPAHAHPRPKKASRPRPRVVPSEEGGAAASQPPAKTIESYREACAANDAQACRIIGNFLHPQDATSALGFWEKACDLGDAMSCVGRGLAYAYPNGHVNDTDGDPRKAVSLFHKACSLGDTGGCKWLGYLYQDGYGVVRDMKEAERLYSKACEMNDADACAHKGGYWGTLPTSN